MAETKNYGQTGVGENVEIGKKGPRIKDNSGVIEHRNSADTDFAITRGADPVGENDLVTKRYLETKSGISVVGQIDGNAPGTGAFTGEIRIVTTAGGSYSLQELYRWDGSQWVQLTVFEGMRISITDPLTGGTDEYSGDHVYLWDEDSTEWIDIGPSQALANVSRARRATITFNDSDGAINVGDVVPQNAIITKITAFVSQGFNDAASTLTVGDAADADRHMESKEICLDVVGKYVSDQYHLYGADTQVTATLSKGSSTQGQVSLLVEYIIQ